MSRPPYRVRASSWGALFDCAHRWEAIHMMGIRSPSGPRALIGTGIHHGTAAYDTGRITGADVDVFTAAELAVDTIRHPQFDVDWQSGDVTKKEAEAIAATLVTKYCREISPLFSYRAVELETKPLQIDCGGGIVIELTGTLDRSRLRDGSHGLGITDLKSGGSAVDESGRARTKGHAAQVGTYELLYQHTTGEPITEPAEIVGLKTRGKPAIGIAEIQNARARMVGDETSPGLIQYAADMFRSGLFPPNPQSMLCGKTYCPRWATCKFHD